MSYLKRKDGINAKLDKKFPNSYNKMGTTTLIKEFGVLNNITAASIDDYNDKQFTELKYQTRRITFNPPSFIPSVLQNPSLVFNIEAKTLYASINLILKMSITVDASTTEATIYPMILDSFNTEYSGNQFYTNYKEYFKILYHYSPVDLKRKMLLKNYIVTLDTSTVKTHNITMTIPLPMFQNSGINISNRTNLTDFFTLELLKMKLTVGMATNFNNFIKTTGGFATALTFIETPRLHLVKKKYSDDRVFSALMKSIKNTKRPYLQFNYKKANDIPFTSDASGNVSGLTINMTPFNGTLLAGIYFQIYKASDELMWNGVDFEFNKLEYLVEQEVMENINGRAELLNRMEAAFDGKLLPSNLDVTESCGEYGYFFSDSNAFDITKIKPEYFDATKPSEIVFYDLSGFAASTAYKLRVLGVRVEGMRWY